MRILIIGGDAAGMSAAMQIRRRQPDWKITVLEKGRYTSYASCGIPYYLARDVPDLEDLVVVSPSAFREKCGVDVRDGWEALEIDSANKHVRASAPDGHARKLVFDRLLIATGAAPIVPRWQGVDLEGVVPVRNLSDTERLDALLDRGPRRAVIIGAGYIGLEMAEALRRRGLEVTVVEKLPGVMGGAEAEVTEQVAAEMEKQGIELRLETEVQALAGRKNRLAVVETTAGPLAADLAILALGVRPNSQLAHGAGIALGASSAIRVDRQQRTSSEDVFAAGDCAEAEHLVLRRPTWIPLALTANRQGRVAGAVISGDDDVFPGVVGSAVTRVFELTLARTGIDEATAIREGIAHETVDVTAPSKAHYFPGHEPLWVKLVYRKDDHKLLGAWLVGRDSSAGKRSDILATAITAGMTIEQIANLDLCYAPPFSPVWDPVLQAASKARFALAASRP